MNTDVALNYKAKLTQIVDKIDEIERIGFNVKLFKDEIEKIITDRNYNEYKSQCKSMKE